MGPRTCVRGPIPYLMVIFRGLDASSFGNLTIRTPLSWRASIFEASILFDNVKER